MTTRFAALAIACLVAASAGCKRSASGEDEAPATTTDAKSGPTAPAPSALPTEFQQVTGATYEGWISPRTSVNPYVPTPADVDALERHTAASLAAAIAAGDIPAEVDLATYVRKYEGYSHQGQRHIEVEYICAESKSLARKHVDVVGGYTCFVKALYNVDTDTLGSWRVNPQR